MIKLSFFSCVVLLQLQRQWQLAFCCSSWSKCSYFYPLFPLHATFWALISFWRGEFSFLHLLLNLLTCLRNTGAVQLWKWNGAKVQKNWVFPSVTTVCSKLPKKEDCATWMKSLDKGPWRGHYRENLKATVLKGTQSSEESQHVKRPS